jgi:hypothetical protein
LGDAREAGPQETFGRQTEKREGKMMKYLLIMLAALAIAGCEDHAQNWHDNGRIYKMLDIDARGDFSIFCDKSTNIAYLRYWQSEFKNGITVYYNSKGEPARCSEIQR